MNSVENVQKKLVEEGLNFIADKIPYVGDKLKDVVSPFILDAIGLREETEPKMTIDDLSKQLSEMSANMNTMENELKDYMDSNTWQLIQAINNDNILTQYKNGMNKLSIGGNSSLSELSELEKCNEDGTPKYKILIVVGTVIGFVVAMLVPYDIIMNYVWVISGWVGLGVTVIMVARVIYNRVKYGKNYGLPAAE